MLKSAIALVVTEYRDVKIPIFLCTPSLSEWDQKHPDSTSLRMISWLFPTNWDPDPVLIQELARDGVSVQPGSLAAKGSINRPSTGTVIITFVGGREGDTVTICHKFGDISTGSIFATLIQHDFAWRQGSWRIIHTSEAIE
jgi:hypothetical protein